MSARTNRILDAIGEVDTVQRDVDQLVADIERELPEVGRALAGMTRAQRVEFCVAARLVVGAFDRIRRRIIEVVETVEKLPD